LLTFLLIITPYFVNSDIIISEHSITKNMANKNPVMTGGFLDRQKAIGLSEDEKVGRKVFGVRLPVSYEEKLNSLPQKDRVILMRQALMSAIDSYGQ
jgi:hypothetical protein